MHRFLAIALKQSTMPPHAGGACLQLRWISERIPGQSTAIAGKPSHKRVPASYRSLYGTPLAVLPWGKRIL
jgi:hypothetical protein